MVSIDENFFPTLTIAVPAGLFYAHEIFLGAAPGQQLIEDEQHGFLGGEILPPTIQKPCDKALAVFAFSFWNLKLVPCAPVILEFEQNQHLRFGVSANISIRFDRETDLGKVAMFLLKFQEVFFELDGSK